MTIISSSLKEALRKNTNTYFMINFSAGIFFAVIGIAVVAAAIFQVATPRWNVILWWVGIILLAAGVGNSFYYWKRRMDIADFIERHPKRVVWVYKKVSSGSLYGATVARFSFVIFGLDDKRRVQVRLSARDADRLLEELKAKLDHTTFGYSPELERKYRDDPQELLRDARRHP